MGYLKIRLFKNKSVFASWLFSYFLLLLMPIVISMIAYIEAYRIVEAEISHVNSEVLKQVQTANDNGLQNIKKFGSFLSYSQNLYLLMQKKSLDSILSQYYLVYQEINDLRSYNLENGYIDDYCIYFKQSDSVLTTNGVEESEYFLQAASKRHNIQKNNVL